MKISLRILFQNEAKRPLLESGQFSEDELSKVAIDLDSEGERLDVFLKSTRDAPGNWFNPVMRFTKKELDSAAFFQLQCRKTLPESDSDYELNDAHVESLRVIEADIGVLPRLPERLSVSQVANLKPNTVAGVGEWLAEFVTGSAVVAAFAEAGLEGYSLRPVLSGKTGGEHADIYQLYTDRMMPRATLDRTTPPSDSGGVRQLGCLVYTDIEQANLADFNRTAEGWTGRGMPLWVVSSKVRDCYLRHKFRGWAFRPVLVRGSEMHRQYERLWDSLFERVAINPRNFF